VKEYTAANLAVVKVAHKGKHRYALHGVYFAPDGWTIGTDGCCLLAVGPLKLDKATVPPPVHGAPLDQPLADAETHDGFIIHSQDITTLKRAMTRVLRIPAGKTMLKPRLFLKESSVTGRSAEFASTEGMSRCLRQVLPTVDGHFPNYKPVIPPRSTDEDAAHVAYFSARLMGELLLAMAECGCETVRMQFGKNPTRASRFDPAERQPNDQEIVGALMPVTFDDGADGEEGRRP